MNRTGFCHECMDHLDRIEEITEELKSAQSELENAQDRIEELEMELRDAREEIRELKIGMGLSQGF